MRRAIEKERQRLSARTGQPASYDTAKRAFLERRLGRFVRGFPRLYCNRRCQARHGCVDPRRKR